MHTSEKGGESRPLCMPFVHWCKACQQCTSMIQKIFETVAIVLFLANLPAVSVIGGFAAEP